MKENHVNEQIRFIKKILSEDGSTMIRKKAYFGASYRQVSLIRRIIKVRHIINSIPGNDRLLVFGGDDDLSWLLRLTTLNKKNIIGIAGLDQINDAKYIDGWHGGEI